MTNARGATYRRIGKRLYVRDSDGRFLVRAHGFCPRRRRRVDDMIECPASFNEYDAGQLRDRIAEAIGLGSYVRENFEAAEPITLEKFTREVIAERATMRKAKTIQSDMYYASSWLHHPIGLMPVERIEFRDVNRWARETLEREDLALNTRRRCVQELQKFLDYALHRGLRPTGDNPAKAVILPSARTNVKPPPMTEPQVIAILQWFREYDARACDGPPRKNSHYTGHYPYFTLQWQWGRRGGELLRMRWTDIDRDDMSVSFADTKTNKPVTIPIEPAHLELIDAHRERLQKHGMPAMDPRSCALVFPSATGRVSHTGSRTSVVFRRALSECNVPHHYTAHHLRAQGAMMLAEHASERAGRAITGHRTEAEWSRYNQATWSERREAMKANAARLAKVRSTEES